MTFTIFAFLQQLHFNIESSTCFKGEHELSILGVYAIVLWLLTGFLRLLNRLWPMMYYVFATLEHKWWQVSPHCLRPHFWDLGLSILCEEFHRYPLQLMCNLAVCSTCANLIGFQLDEEWVRSERERANELTVNQKEKLLLTCWIDLSKLPLRQYSCHLLFFTILMSWVILQV